MAEQYPALPATLVVGHGRDGRCVYDRDAKRALVEMALRPGVSVARLALQNDLNANVLRRWIGEHHKSLEAIAGPRRSGAITLVPVTAAKESASVTVSPKRDADAAALSSIEIDIGGATVRLRGSVDASQLRTVFDCLMRT